MHAVGLGLALAPLRVGDLGGETVIVQLLLGLLRSLVLRDGRAERHVENIAHIDHIDVWNLGVGGHEGGEGDAELLVGDDGEGVAGDDGVCALRTINAGCCWFLCTPLARVRIWI